MKQKKISRRDFVKGAAVAGAGLALGGRALAMLRAGDQAAIDRAIRDLKMGGLSDEETQAIVRVYMTSGPVEPIGPHVVHVHSTNATFWDFGDDYYGNFVDQNVVNEMVDQGVMQLTGASTVAGAWRLLLPDYVEGKGIAVKLNFNNSSSDDDNDLIIDGLIHPVNAVVRGLKQMGVAEADVWLFDAMRCIPDRFVNGCLYNPQFFDGWCRLRAGWSSSDLDAIVTYRPSSGPAPPFSRISDVMINATYLINVPIIKTHGAGVTLGFKNHFGTINNPAEMHDYVYPPRRKFSTEYSPLVEIYQNPHIGAKTVLTIGDGLFGCWISNLHKPRPWVTFGDSAPNSLFFATDPVALDSVMYDFLAAETSVLENGDAYLSLAASAGLGVFEHGDPWGSGYIEIDYDKIEI